MPSWNEILSELTACDRNNPLDFIRRKYLLELNKKRGRNVIAYYSGWLQRPGILETSISDDDKNGLMAVIHKLDRSNGLDILLHTPGGDMAATESIVDYLHKMFGNDIECFIPQIAMSGGTMIACSGKLIHMGKQSNIGPIDPQFGGIPAHGVIEEFEEAIAAAKNEPTSIPIWQTIISKYHPTFVGECRNAITLADDIVQEWLARNMFSDLVDPKKKAAQVTKALNNHSDTKIHARHIPIEKAKKIGLRIVDLEKDQNLQDLVLTVHHCFMHTFANSTCIKIIENHNGQCVMQKIAQAKGHRP